MHIYIFFLSIYVLLLYNTILSINTLITASLHHLCVRILIYNIYICMCIYIYIYMLFYITFHTVNLYACLSLFTRCVAFMA